MAYTATELISQVRSQIQEKNQSALSDADILAALNRGLDYAMDIMVRRYVDPLIKSYAPTFDSDNQADVPEDAFEQRIMAMEYKQGNIFRELIALQYHETLNYETTGSYPIAYSILGDKIEVYPTTSGHTFRAWYVEEIPALIEGQGRIVGIDGLLPRVDNYTIVQQGNDGTVTFSGVPTHTGGTYKYRVEVVDAGAKTFKWRNNATEAWSSTTVWVDDVAQTLENGVTIKFASGLTYVTGDKFEMDILYTNASITLDAVGNALSTDGAYTKYVNVIDHKTGRIKSTLQINSITGDILTFSETPDRTVVLDRTISTTPASDVELDDYICPIEGSCVIFLKRPMFNFVEQYAVAEARRALGYDVTVEENKLAKLEKQLQKMRSGRTQTLRVKLNNPRYR